MTDDESLAVLARLTERSPVDLDAPFARIPAAGAARTRQPRADDDPSPAAALWARDDPALSFVGIRVDAPLSDPRRLAARLAAVAVERGVIAIILTSCPLTGLEPFGFRIERLPAAPEDERARCEREIARFWGLAIIVDAADAARLS